MASSQAKPYIFKPDISARLVNRREWLGNLTKIKRASKGPVHTAPGNLKTERQKNCPPKTELFEHALE